MLEIAELISKTLDRNTTDYSEIKSKVKEITERFPLYPDLD